MKPVRLTKHALEQCAERGATEAEVIRAVAEGSREKARHGRTLCRFNFGFNQTWQGVQYAMKQVAPVIVEELDETVIVTVYTYYY
jgi:hypothetical protein